MTGQRSRLLRRKNECVVLLVDDDPWSMRQLALELERKCGLGCIEALNPLAGMRELELNPQLLVVVAAARFGKSDIGHSLLAEVARKRPHARRVIHSEHTAGWMYRLKLDDVLDKARPIAHRAARICALARPDEPA